MLSAALVAATLGALSSWTAQSAKLLPELLLWTALLLVGVNLLGAYIIFEPIRRYLSGHRVEQQTWERRVRRLPIYSGLWVVALSAALMFAFAVVAHSSWQSLATVTRDDVLATSLRGAVFAGLLGMYMYLLIVDFSISLRHALWLLGTPLSLQRGHFARRLIIASLAVALGPSLIALSDHWDQKAVPTEMPMRMPMGFPIPTSTDAKLMSQHHRSFMAQTLQIVLSNMK